VTPREDARRILTAAVAAADARAAVLRALELEDDVLVVAGEERIPLSSIDRVWVIGAGKARLPGPRSEERRVGKECRSRWSPYH